MRKIDRQNLNLKFEFYLNKMLPYVLNIILKNINIILNKGYEEEALLKVNQ